ncbi:OmpA family protein [Paracoccus spongiarum]|uniref:OmpA family protein n=1 Tax=Paracoccus spongiarum TaxID=3064387 RepID=A0ABT9JEB2_9RHOB|nr:OmpA family protein [Paracoccus sp. 2205BS29-5]MDP5308170.1 OmpA family protein [Paracoccus sp. 2205BS29-5]
MAQSRRRFSTALASLIVLSGAAGLCWWGADSAASFIEQRSREDVSLALATGGQDWAEVETDGLRVYLRGTAPNEVQRFRAMTQAASAVDASRIVDEMTVASAEALRPPDFKIELLRDGDGISLIGLVPATTDRADLVRVLKSETAAPKITDMLEAADYAVPEGWDAAMRFGLVAAQQAGRAKISIAPGRVHVTAIADSRAEKGRLETDLKRMRPAEVTLKTDISAPRPVIAPFTLRFLIDAEGARFDACAADNDAGRTRILDAAVRAGATGKPGCTLGLGAPAAEWADAAVASIEAVAELGAGTVTLSDADIALSAPAEVDQAQFDEVAGRLESRLPRVFSLQARKDRPEEADQGRPEFVASLAGDRALSMRGRITDARMRQAVDSFARSRFRQVQGALRSDSEVPGGWTVRVIAALEAMDGLASGTAEVTPDLIRLSGLSGDPDATERIAATLAERLGPGARYDLSLRYDRRLDPALDLPDGEECVRQLNIILSESEIGFEPSKSTIAGDPGPTLARMAEVMAECAEFQLEAGGHTDSQGSEGFNADLSRARAQALVAAMTEAGIDTANTSARGYGESQPIAANDTEAGREENRRIEFRLLSERPVRNTPLAAPVTLSGTTTSEPEGPAPRAPEAGAGHGAEGGAAAGGVEGPEGPPMPVPLAGPAMAPATVGVSEVFETLDEREEKIRLPVQTPDENTPRPSPRPGDAEAAAQAEGATGSE